MPQARSRRRPLQLTRLPGVVTCLLLAGCAGGPSSEPETASARAVHEQLWEEADLRDYRFSYQQQCFCVREQVQPVTIEVRGDRVERVLSVESGEDLSTNPDLRWPTISELFALIEAAEVSGQEPLDVRYDPRLGYPTHVEIGSLAADAGVVYSASELRPL